MSLILDALNKADRKRDTQEPVPNLESYATAIKQPQNPAFPQWAIFVVIGLLLIVVIVLLIFLFRQFSVASAPYSDFQAKSPSSPALAIQPLPEETLPRETIEVALTKDVSPAIGTSLNQEKSENTESPNIPQVLEPEIAAIYEGLGDDSKSPKTRSPSAETNEVSVLYSEPKQKTAPQKVSQLNKRESENSNTKDDQLLVPEDELQALWREVQQSAKDPTATAVKPINPYANIPFLYQLPESFQSRIPTLMYQNHIYSKKGSAVILNGKTYRKGDILAQDLIIDDVTEGELILSYLNRPFKLAALSSWVQMK